MGDDHEGGADVPWSRVSSSCICSRSLASSAGKGSSSTAHSAADHARASAAPLALTARQLSGMRRRSGEPHHLERPRSPRADLGGGRPPPPGRWATFCSTAYGTRRGTGKPC